MAKPAMKSGWLVVSAFVGLGAVVYGCGGNRGTAAVDHTAELYRESLTRMSALSRGMLMYGNDWDDALPPAGRWMDATGPYVQDESAYVSPALEGRATEYGYAFNLALAGVTTGTIEDPYNTVLIFDSSITTRNATAPTDSMANPPRYGTDNTISYANGRVKDSEIINPQTFGQIAVSRIRSLAVGISLYSSDYDDRLPVADQWYQGTFPYVRVDQYYRSPALANNQDAYGFALNEDVAGRSIFEFESPAATPGLFDSTNLSRSATAPLSTSPNPARYEGGNAQTFLDGHAGQVP